MWEVASEGFVLVNVASMAAHLVPALLMPKRAGWFGDKGARVLSVSPGIRRDSEPSANCQLQLLAEHALLTCYFYGVRR